MGEGVTVCMLRCMAVAVFRNCGLWCVWELHYGRVSVCGGRGDSLRMSALKKNPCFSIGRISKTWIFRLNADNLNVFSAFFVFSAFCACSARKKNI